MIDIKFLRENPDAVRENMKKKFQDAKLTLVDEVIALDRESREVQQEADLLQLRQGAVRVPVPGHEEGLCVGRGLWSDG